MSWLLWAIGCEEDRSLAILDAEIYIQYHIVKRIKSFKSTTLEDVISRRSINWYNLISQKLEDQRVYILIYREKFKFTCQFEFKYKKY